MLCCSCNIVGRPDMFMLRLIEPPDLPGIATLQYCPHLKLYRKLTHAALRNFLTVKHNQHYFQEMASTEAKRLISRFSSKNGKPFYPGTDIVIALGDIALVTLCGSDNIENYIDRSQFTSILKLLRNLTPTLCFNSVLDVYPPMGYFAQTLNRVFGGGIEKLLLAISKLLFIELENHNATFNKDNIRDIIDAMIKAKEEAEIEDNVSKAEILSDKNIVGAMTDLFVGSIATTSSSIEWYLLYMIAYPDIQQKVQDEIENVVGNNRYPTLEDRENLPYFQATILESLRLSTTAALSAPRETIENVELHDCSIPSKTMIWVNMWSIHHDEKLWPEPDTFRPERHLNSDGTVNSSSPNLMPFGCGARVCIGETLARFNLYMILSHLLHHYKFKKADKNEDLDLSTQTGFAVYCKEYELIATPKLADGLQ